MIRAGFVGLGSQGAGMAQRIIEQGVPTTLWARSAQSLEPFAGTAVFAADPVELGRASDVVGICVTDGAAVRDVTLGPRGVLAGMAAGRDLQHESCPIEIRSLGRTLIRWRDQIAAWHRGHVSNGPTEAANNLIKRIKRIAFGFTRFRNYRIRVLLYAGKPNWDLLATIKPR